MVWEGEGEFLRAEKIKRQKRIDEEKQRIERERMERLKQRKDAVTYSDTLAAEICGGIGSGELLTLICLDEHMPTVRKANAWLREHVDFKVLLINLYRIDWQYLRDC